MKPVYLLIPILLLAMGKAVATFAQDKVAEKRWDLKKRLYFPVEKNQAKILPQRFEYQLENQDSFRIGDSLFTGKDFQISFSPDPKSRERYILDLVWPSALLATGEVQIKDSASKTLWKQELDPKLTEVNKKKSESGHRAWVSKTKISNVPTSILQRLINYPFFQICIQRRDRETMVSLCSPDYIASLEARGGKESEKATEFLNIRDQEGLREKSIVEINGQEVDAQGAIFLKNETDFIFLKATFKSGASIEIQTSLKSVRFLDLEKLEDPKRVLLRGTGAVPADPSGISRIGPTTWEGRLNLSRPSLFLRGEGGIPLRQEFLLSTTGRDPKIRVELLDVFHGGNEDFYILQAGGETAEFKLKNLTEHRLEGHGEGSRITYKGSEIFWEISGLKLDETSSRYVKLKVDNEDLIAAFDFKRKRTKEVLAQFTFPLGLDVFARTDPLHSRFSFSGSLKTHLARAKASDPLMQEINVGAAFHPRFAREEYLIPPYQLGLQASHLMSSGTALQALSATAGTSYFLPNFLRSLGDWGHIQLELLLLGGKADLKLRPSTSLEIQFRSHEQLSPTYGLFVESLNFDASGVASQIQRVGLSAGYSYSF